MALGKLQKFRRVGDGCTLYLFGSVISKSGCLYLPVPVALHHLCSMFSLIFEHERFQVADATVDLGRGYQLGAYATVLL